MMKPLLLLCVIIALAKFADALFGYAIAYRIAYGAFTILAVVIALTFFWLWAKRSTPLALGMAFSWTGAATVMGWWWIFKIFGEPGWMEENSYLFVFLSLYFVGAMMHLEVIGRSFGVSRRIAMVPIWLAGGVSAALAFFF